MAHGCGILRGFKTFAAGGDQTVRLWDLTAPAPLAREAGSWRGHWSEVWSVLFSRDGARIVTGGKDAKVKLWHAEPPERRVADVKIPGDAVHAGFFTDGSRFRIKLPDRIRFFSVSHGEPARANGSFRPTTNCSTNFGRATAC